MWWHKEVTERGRHSPDTKSIEVLFLDFSAYQTVNNEHLFALKVPCLRYLAIELSVDQYDTYRPFNLRHAKFWPRCGAVQQQTQHSGVWGRRFRTLKLAKATQWNPVFRKVEGGKKRYLWLSFASIVFSHYLKCSFLTSEVSTYI